MVWAFLWFRNQKEEWEQRARQSKEGGLAGHVAYAHKQSAMWERFMAQAKVVFEGKWVGLGGEETEAFGAEQSVGSV